MRSLLIGIFSGLLLSALRAPLGLELLQVPASTPGAAVAYRAAALLVIGLGLILGLRRNESRLIPTSILIGTAIGYHVHWQLVNTPQPFLVQIVFSLLLVLLLVAGHGGGPETRPNKVRIVLLGLAALGGWFLIDNGYPESHGGAIGTALIGLLAITIVGRSTGSGDTRRSKLEDPEPERSSGLPLGSSTSIAICGAGLAILVEGLARHLRLLGNGHLEDDSVFGSAFLFLCFFGIIGFAHQIKQRRSVLLARGCVAGASGLAVWAALPVLRNFSTSRGLDLHVRQFDALGMNWDLAIHGLPEYDLIVAGPVLVVAAFVCGTMIGLHRRVLELSALLLGAAAGLVLSPGLLAFEWSSSFAENSGFVTSSSSAAMAYFGGLIAAGGALLMFLTSAELKTNARLIGCVVAFGGIALCKFPEHEAVPILSPWERQEAQPVWVLDAPEGLLTVEKDTRGELFATLDRRPLCPTSPGVAADHRRLQQSYALLGDWAKEEGPRVLFVGQLNPNRALFLSDLGAKSIDRTASWFPAMEAIEHELFGGTPKWFPGKILSLIDARAALDRGDYDLVIVPPVSGDAATTRNLASPKETTVVVWLDGAGGIEDQHLGEYAWVTVPDLTDMTVAVARGPHVEALRLAGEQGGPGFLAAGEPIRGLAALDFLSTRKEQRKPLRLAHLARRFAQAERSPGIAAGLAVHFESQRPSSPFETPAEQIEINPEAAQRFSEAAAGPSPSALVIEVIETLSYLLGAQRKVEEIDEFLTLPAEKHSPWPALEISLGQAALEFLEPEIAVQHLRRAHEGWLGSPLSWAMQAEAEQQIGEDRAAADSLERAHAMDPTNHAIERRLAIAWRRVGDPRGVEALREALAEEPEDAELLRHQGDGPYPPPAPGYHGIEGHGH